MLDIADSAVKTDPEFRESGGIIDASDALGRGWYLFDAQVHAPTLNPDYVQHGQLLAMRVSSFRDVYGG